MSITRILLGSIVFYAVFMLDDYLFTPSTTDSPMQAHISVVLMFITLSPVVYFTYKDLIRDRYTAPPL